MKTPITLFLIIVTAVVSIMAFSNRELFNRLKFNAYMVYHKRDYGRLLSHGLLHGDWMHLIVNMFVLWSFGGHIEQMFMQLSGMGKFWYVLMYVTALVVASLPATFKHKNSHSYNAVGASGAVAAVLFASIMLAPSSGISFIFIPFIDIPAWIFGLAYLAYSYYMTKRGGDNIAHDAHFAGAIYGFLFPLLLEPSLISRFFVLITGG